VGKVDVDVAGELAQDYGVSSIPTLIVLKDGAEVKRFVGVTPVPELRKAIDAALA
jgi:thioredoxin 1